MSGVAAGSDEEPTRVYEIGWCHVEEVLKLAAAVLLAGLVYKNQLHVPPFALHKKAQAHLVGQSGAGLAVHKGLLVEVEKLHTREHAAARATRHHGRDVSAGGGRAASVRPRLSYHMSRLIESAMSFIIRTPTATVRALTCRALISSEPLP